MSVWTFVTGTYNVHKDKHFSLKKYTKELYDEISIQEDAGKFNMSFSLDGVDAAKFVENWISGIPGTVDCEAEIRFLK